MLGMNACWPILLHRIVLAVEVSVSYLKKERRERERKGEKEEGREKRERERERHRDRDGSSVGSISKWLQNLGIGSSQPGAGNSKEMPCMGSRDPSP